MQDSFRFVQKDLVDVRIGDYLMYQGYPMRIYDINLSGDGEPLCIGCGCWLGVSALKSNDILTDGKYNILEPETCPHTEIRMGADNAVAGIVFEGETFIRQTAEPEPEQSPLGEVKYRVVQKRSSDVRVGDVIWFPDFSHKPIVFEEWPSINKLANRGFVNEDATVNILEPISGSHVADNATTEPESPQNPWERLAEMYPDGVTVRDLWEKHGVTFTDGCLSTMLGRKGPVNNPSKRVLDVFESLCDDDKLRFSVCYVLLSVFTKRAGEVEETAHMRFVLQGPQVPFFDFFDIAKEAEPEPTPETRIIPIDGVKHVITRKPCGGWGEPVVWGPSVGDEVELGNLKQGDRLLIECDVFEELNEHGYVGVLFDKEDQLFLDGDQKAIYNGRVE